MISVLDVYHKGKFPDKEKNTCISVEVNDVNNFNDWRMTYV